MSNHGPFELRVDVKAIKNGFYADRSLLVAREEVDVVDWCGGRSD
jgi:hypothetical protein